MIINLMTYNIHKGKSPLNRNLIMLKIKEALKHTNTHILCLQETVGEKFSLANKPIVIHQNQAEFLAENYLPHFIYKKNALTQKGHHGNAIISKFPIESSSQTDISTNILEQRGFLHVIIDIKGVNLHILNVHLSLFASGRKKQEIFLSKYINEKIPKNAPVVIAGDFNDWQGIIGHDFIKSLGFSEAFKTHRGKHAKTFPSTLPMLTLDRIYCKNIKINSAHILQGNPWNKFSDHLPLSTELTL